MRVPCARSEVAETLLTADVVGEKIQLDLLALEVGGPRNSDKKEAERKLLVGLFSEPANQSMDSGRHTSSQAKAKICRLKP